MKFRALALLISILAAAASAAAQFTPPTHAAAPADEITYTMPQGWVIQPIQGGPELKAHYAFYYQGIPCGEMYLYGSPLTGTGTVDQVFQDGLAKIRPALPYYQSRGLQKVNVGGMPTVVHDFSYLPAGSGVAFMARTYTMIAGGSVYTFWFQSVPNYFQGVQAAFGQVMTTVKAAPKPAPAPEANVADVPAKTPITSTAAVLDKSPAAADAPKHNPAWATPPAKTGGGLPALVEDQPEPGLYPDPRGRYKIKLPDDAVQRKTEDNASWFRMPAAKTLFIIHNCPNDEIAAGLAARFAAGKKLSGTPTVLAVSGREATVSLYTAKDADGENLAWIVASYKGTGLLIVVNLPAKDYAGAQGWIGGLLRGVRLSAE
jgi:hypothetical protein